MKTGTLFSIESITPNPATNSIRVDFQNLASQSASFEIMDALGITRQFGKASEHRVTIDVSSLPSGLYYFRASSGGRSKARTIVIQH
jgi:hypothetical protein